MGGRAPRAGDIAHNANVVTPETRRVINCVSPTNNTSIKYQLSGHSVTSVNMKPESIVSE